MASVKTIYVGESNYLYATNLVDKGEFTSFSDVLMYCMRFLCDVSKLYGVNNLPALDRTNLRKVNVRIPSSLIKELQSLNFAKSFEVYDLALQYYSTIRG